MVRYSEDYKPYCRKCNKEMEREEYNKNMGYCKECRETYKDEFEQEKRVNSYTNAKVLSFLFPPLGFLGAIIHIENRALSKLFTSYAVIGIVVCALIIGTLILPHM